jgi:PAS domain S-box-containing protein
MTNLDTLKNLTAALTNGLDEIRLRAELLSVLFNGVSCGVFIVGADKKILAANYSILNALGYDTEEELIGKTVMEITKPGDIGSKDEDLKKLWSEDFSGRVFKKSYLRKDNSPYPANAKIFHLHNQFGYVTRSVILIEGIN